MNGCERYFGGCCICQNFLLTSYWLLLTGNAFKEDASNLVDEFLGGQLLAPALLLKQAIADIYMIVEKLKQQCVRATPLLIDIYYLDFLVQILNSKVKLVNGEEAQTHHLHIR